MMRGRFVVRGGKLSGAKVMGAISAAESL